VRGRRWQHVHVTDTDSVPGSSIPLATLPNLRDLGGWRTADGRQVAYGLLFPVAQAALGVWTLSESLSRGFVVSAATGVACAAAWTISAG